MTTYLDSGNLDKAKSFLPKFNSQLMKVAKTGVINKKKVSRKISRLTKKINKTKKNNIF